MSVDFNSGIITDVLLLSIFSACPSIREVVLGEYCEIDPSALLTSHTVHALDSLIMESFVFRMFPCESSRSKCCCEIVIKDGGDMAFLHTFFANTLMAMRGITFSESDSVPITTDMLRILADAYGHSLEKCELHLSNDIEQEDMQYFLSHCPNMVELSLTTCLDDNILIDDADMRNLPVWCPRIAKLELIDCAVDIADDSFIYALERWSANSITAINLQGCRLLTDAVLPVIERCCPQLTSLSVRYTSFSKEALLQFVVTVAQNAVFCLLEVDHISRVWIVHKLKTKHGKLWRKLKVVSCF